MRLTRNGITDLSKFMYPVPRPLHVYPSTTPTRAALYSTAQAQLHPSSRGASQARLCRDASWQAPRSVGKRKGLSELLSAAIGRRR